MPLPNSGLRQEQIGVTGAHLPQTQTLALPSEHSEYELSLQAEGSLVQVTGTCGKRSFQLSVCSLPCPPFMDRAYLSFPKADPSWFSILPLLLGWTSSEKDLFRTYLGWYHPWKLGSGPSWKWLLFAQLGAKYCWLQRSYGRH